MNYLQILMSKEIVPESALVCGRKMTIPAERYHHTNFRGQTIYFCTEICLEHFQRDPKRFYEAHSRGKN